MGELVQYLGLRDLGDVIVKIYGSKAPKTLIAGFAKYVVEEAIKGMMLLSTLLRRKPVR